jgi:hypothetical protein
MLQPILIPLLTDRRASLVWVGAVASHLVLSELGVGGWPCPIRHVLNVPCPGCGLTRATNLLLHGQWQKSLETHAFAPLVIVAAVLLLLSVMLPGETRQRVLLRLERIERRTGFAVLSVLALVGYWLARMLFFGDLNASRV